MTDAPATIGHNSPPEAIIEMSIDDLFAEAELYLDGTPIESEGQAEAVKVLLDRLRQHRKLSDDKRAEEKRPHDDAAKAVQAKWKPLLDKCDTASNAIKAALTGWLARQEAERIAREEAARAEADRLQREAEAAKAAADPTNLSATRTANARAEVAASALKAANRIGKEKVHAKGEGRAVGLRTYWEADLSDPVAALKHYRQAQPEALKAWLLEQAQRDVRAGSRSIPGFNITEQRKAA